MVNWSFNKMDDRSRVEKSEIGTASSFSDGRKVVEALVAENGKMASGLVWSKAKAEVCESLNGDLVWSPCGVPNIRQQ